MDTQIPTAHLPAVARLRRWFALASVAILLVVGGPTGVDAQLLCSLDLLGKPYEIQRVGLDAWLLKMNNRGDVVGYEGDFFRGVYIKSDLTRHVLSSAPDDELFTWAADVNDSGVVVGNYRTEIENFEPGFDPFEGNNAWAYQWSEQDGLVDLADIIPGIPGEGDFGGYTEAVAINNNDHILLRVTTSTQKTTYYWNGATLTALRGAAECDEERFGINFNDAFVADFNDSGVAVGTAFYKDETNHCALRKAVSWNGGGRPTVVASRDPQQTYGHGVNATGSFVGSYGEAGVSGLDETVDAFRDAAILAAVPGARSGNGHHQTTASAVNDNGYVAGWDASGPLGGTTSFGAHIWSPAGALTNVAETVWASCSGIRIDRISDLNNNLEFIYADQIFRPSRPVVRVTVRGDWFPRDQNGFRDSFFAQVRVKNIGALDLQNIVVRPYVDRDVLRFEAQIDELPTDLPAQQNSNEANFLFIGVGPGDTQVSFTVTAQSEDGQTATHSASVAATVEGVGCTIDIKLPGAEDTAFDIKEEFVVQVGVKASGQNDEDIVNANFVESVLYLSDPTLVDVVSGPTPVRPSNFTLAPGDAKLFEYTLRAKAEGRLAMSSKVTSQTESGIDLLPAIGRREIQIVLDALDIKLEADPALIDLEDDENGPVPEDIPLKVTIKNIFDQPLENVTLKGLTLTSIINPTPVVGALVEKAGPFDPDGPNPDPTMLGTLAPGESIVRNYTLEARDDGRYRVDATVEMTNPLGAGTISEFGRTRVEMRGDVILYFEGTSIGTSDRGGALGWVMGGEQWLIRGKVENRSSDETILAVLQPKVGRNASYAIPIPDGVTPPGDDVCGIGIARLLEPGESVHFTAPVRTDPNGATRSMVEFAPTGFIINDDDTRTALTEDEIFVKEGSELHVVSVDTRDIVEDATAGEVLYTYTVGTLVGLGRLAEGAMALGALAKEVHELSLKPWEVIPLYWRGADKAMEYVVDVQENLPPGDKEAFRQSALAAIVFSTGMAASDAAKLVNSVVEEPFTEMSNAIYTGDAREIARLLGEFSGENIDLLAGGLPKAAAKGWAFCQLGRRGFPAGRRALLAKAAAVKALLIEEAALGARALSNGQFLDYAKHLRPIFGIDKLSDKLFRELAKEGIVVVVRRRGAGVVAKLESGLFRLKPFWVKAKNVNLIDVKFLEFPNNLDEVLIGEPPPWTRVEAKLNGATPDVQAQVRQRWEQRMDEWHGKPDKQTGIRNFEKSERAKLQAYADGGKIPHTKTDGVNDNVIEKVKEGFSDPMDAPDTELRHFSLEQVSGPTGQPALAPLMGEFIAAPGTPNLKRLTGDIDPMAFLTPDMQILPEVARKKLYEVLRKYGFQHPESITWTSETGRAAYLKEFSHQNGNAEALVAYHPDGSVRATRFDIGRSWIDPFAPASNQAMMFLGATTSIKAAEVVIRDRPDLEALVDGARPLYLGPNTWSLVHPGCGGSLQGGLVVEQTGGQACMLTVQFRNEPATGGLFARTPSGPGIPILRQTLDGTLESWTEAGGWEPYVPDSISVTTLPQTYLTNDVLVGTTLLPVADLEALGLDPLANDWFEPGHTIVIDPGGENEEYAVVANGGSIVLAAPLQREHVFGETVTALGKMGATTTTLPPTTTTTLPVIGERPVRPTILAVTADTTRPLSEFDLTMSAFTDADEAGPASGIEVKIDGPLDTGAIGGIFRGHLLVTDPQTMRLPAALLDVGTDYTVVARYFDSSGAASEFSEPFAFATVADDPNDLNADGVEDRAELAGSFDLNDNGVDDASERIVVIANAEAGDPLGVFVGFGMLSNLSTLSEAEAIAAANPAVLLERLPIGLVGFRVGALDVGQSVQVSQFLMPNGAAAESWTQLDKNVGFVDMSDQTSIFDTWVTVEYVDGGSGDQDGVANGRIVDTNGAVGAAGGELVCSAPISQSTDGPSAVDCLYVLRTAVGLETCTPPCSCAPKGSMPVSAVDALVCLKVAVGVAGVVLDCPCGP